MPTAFCRRNELGVEYVRYLYLYLYHYHSTLYHRTSITVRLGLFLSGLSCNTVCHAQASAVRAKLEPGTRNGAHLRHCEAQGPRLIYFLRSKQLLVGGGISSRVIRTLAPSSNVARSTSNSVRPD